MKTKKNRKRRSKGGDPGRSSQHSSRRAKSLSPHRGHRHVPQRSRRSPGRPSSAPLYNFSRARRRSPSRSPRVRARNIYDQLFNILEYGNEERMVENIQRQNLNDQMINIIINIAKEENRKDTISDDDKDKNDMIIENLEMELE
jgi:hypothetical protein